jgi:hypothetical protein
VTTHQLLGAIRDTGRICAGVINPPGGRHCTAAAKITFFTTGADQRFLAQANDPQRPGFGVDGSLPVVRADKNRVAESNEPADRTRCVMISGPRDIVTVERLSAYFSANFVYKLDEIIPLDKNCSDDMGPGTNQSERGVLQVHPVSTGLWRSILSHPHREGGQTGNKRDH